MTLLLLLLTVGVLVGLPGIGGGVVLALVYLLPRDVFALGVWQATAACWR